MENRPANRLAREKSPYLLQHAHNPVDWYPWGDEAFARARAEDKPIFLSIGYATCHWCHVMERESFEDDSVASLLNASFVPIKVDREERPDVDHVYMQSVMAMTGQGGWPLSAFLTPDGRPFFGGTYFPPDDRFGRPGFKRILGALAEAWQARRAEVLESADQLVTHLTALADRAVAMTNAGPLSAQAIQLGVEQAAASFDRTWGGIGRAPKFPRSHLLSFLLGAGARTGDAHALTMVEHTLDRMARGGIHDHLGGGFHRYSVDERWLVPHFEKMLYDQALIARSYVEAYQITGKAAYADVARGIFDYVLRDLAAPEGAFYSAEDADSEGVEGKFYVWTPDEIEAALGPEESKFFAAVYDVTKSGNFEHGWSILNLPRSIEQVAAEHGAEPEVIAKRLAPAREKLRDLRTKRIRPLRDDKVLTDWNGLMIGAMAYGARALGETKYLEAAERAARFVLDHLRREDGRLLKRWREGEAAGLGFLDDYAFLAWGLLDLYAATQKVEYLEAARDMTRAMLELFRDREAGGFRFTATDSEQLLIESKELYDGAVPSGNAVASLVLQRLGALLADPDLAREGREVLETFGGHLEATPLAYPQMMIALDLALGPSAEVVLAGDPQSPELAAMRQALDRKFLPRVSVAVLPDGKTGDRLREMSPFLAGLGPARGPVMAYVCQDGRCALPTAELDAMLEQVTQVGQAAMAGDRASAE